MYHSITIGTKNTWDDWHLIPTSRPLVNPPPAKTSFVEVPGMDGSLDLSTAMTGKPVYADRTGSWSFYVENDFKEWHALYSEIMNYLHGQEYKATLEDDPGFYYEGRFAVNEWRSDAARSLIVINYEVGPYKMYEASDDDKWLWDPFYFGNPKVSSDKGDYIKHYKDLIVKTGSPLTVVVNGDKMDTVPVITVGATGVVMTFEGVQYKLKKGPNGQKDLDGIVIDSGDNVFTFTYNGGRTTVSFNIIGGRL